MAEESIFGKLARGEIQNIANTFAAAFAERGILGGSATSDAIRPKKKTTPEDRNAINQQRASAVALGSYIDAHEAAARGERDAMLTQIKAQRSLQKHSKAVGDSFVTVANNLSDGAITQVAAKKEQKEMLSTAINSRRAFDGLNEVTIDTESAFSKLKDSAKSWSDSFFSRQTAMALATKATVQGINDFRSSMKYGTDVSNGLFSNMLTAAKMGIDPAALSELGASTRQAQNAMGGAAHWGNQLSNVQKTLFKQIGDLEETARFTSEGMMTLGIAGIKPTTDMFVDSNGKLSKLGIQFDEIRKITGSTFSETSALMREFVENEAVRYKLVGKSSQIERKAILQEVMARHANFTALGLTTQQATRAAQALDSMAGRGPLDRFKKAAQLQMAASAMGMAAEGAQLAALERLGRRRTPEQDEKYLKIMGKMNEKVAKSQTGSFAQEIFASSITQRAGLDDVLGESSPFITSLGESLSVDKAQLAQIQTIADESTVASKATSDMVYWSSIIAANTAHNPLISAAAAGLAGIGAGVITIVALLKARSILNSVPGLDKKGKGKKAATVAKSAVRGSASTALAAGKSAAMMAIPVAATVAASLAAYQGGKAIVTGKSDISDKFNESLPEIATAFSDKLGIAVDSVRSFFGDSVAERRLAIVKDGEIKNSLEAITLTNKRIEKSISTIKVEPLNIKGVDRGNISKVAPIVDKSRTISPRELTSAIDKSKMANDSGVNVQDDVLAKAINGSALSSGVSTTNTLLHRMVELNTEVQRTLMEVSANSGVSANELSKMNRGGFKGNIPGTK